MKNLAVAKIGGSILRNPQGMRDALNVLEKHPQIKIVVISATYNTTNELEEIAKASLGEDLILENLYLNLLEKHLFFIEELGLNSASLEMIKNLIEDARRISAEIKKEGIISLKNMDALYSTGELISAQLFASFLGDKLKDKKIKFLDARKLIKTDSSFNSAKPLKLEIKKTVDSLILSEINENTLFVVPGFIGSNELGETTTLGREGSDFSAALVAEATSANELQIWKDVPGIFTGDPKLISNAKPVLEISYDDVNRFSEKGAKILFPSALIPVMQANIPVYIGWIHDHSKGTKILKNNGKSPKLIGVTKQSEFLRFEIEKKNPEISSLKFLENIQVILKEQKIKYRSIYLDGEKVIFHFPIKDKFPELALEHLKEFSFISKFPNISLICIVGVEIDYFGSKIDKLVSDLERDGISLIPTERNPNYITFSFPSRVEEKVINFVHDRLFLNK